MDIIIYSYFQERFLQRIFEIEMKIIATKGSEIEMFKQYENARDALEALDEIGKQRGWV